jgi:ubiquinone/menaquinone biosynthesis C-methylase UbiE
VLGVQSSREPSHQQVSSHVDSVRVKKKQATSCLIETLFSRIYDFYSFDVIPALGQMIANDRESYKYLVESIRQFPPQPAFAKIIRDAGFSTVGKGWEDLTFGVAAIHSGFKI